MKLTEMDDIGVKNDQNGQDALLKRFGQLSEAVSNMKKTVGSFGGTDVDNPNSKRLRSGILSRFDPTTTNEELQYTIKNNRDTIRDIIKTNNCMEKLVN